MRPKITGGFWRTISRIASASSWLSGSSRISTSEVIAPSGSICTTRVPRWVTDRTWSWLTG